MARQEQEREDLLREAVALVERIEVQTAREQGTVVIGFRRDGAASVYFDDPDGHSLEYIALLDDAPRPDLGTLPLSAWRRLHA